MVLGIIGALDLVGPRPVRRRGGLRGARARLRHDRRSGAARPRTAAFALAGSLTGGGGLLMVGVGVWTTSLVVERGRRLHQPAAGGRRDHPLRDRATRRLVIAGTIENLGDRTCDYRILIDVLGHRAPRPSVVVVSVDDVAPGLVHQFGTPIGGLDLLSDDDTPTCVLDDDHRPAAVRPRRRVRLTMITSECLLRRAFRADIRRETLGQLERRIDQRPRTPSWTVVAVIHAS